MNTETNGEQGHPGSDMATISKKWRIFWWFFLAIGLAAPFGLKIFQDVMGGHLPISSWLELLFSVVLLCVVLIVAFKLWQHAEADRNASNGERLSQVFIFAIMVTSFYAFGWPDDFLHRQNRAGWEYPAPGPQQQGQSLYARNSPFS